MEVWRLEVDILQWIAEQGFACIDVGRTEASEATHRSTVLLHNAPVMAGDKSAGDGICQGMLVTQGDFCECWHITFARR